MDFRNIVESPFPREIIFLSARIDDVALNLHPDESALSSHWRSKRRRKEFAAGRTLARTALAKHGVENFALLQGAAREPLWPHGFVGSVTHGAEHVAVALTNATRARGLGIDLEGWRDASDPYYVKHVCHELEEGWACEDSTKLSERVIMLFSVKESIFKALYPSVRRHFFYKDASVTFDASLKCWEATLQSDLSSDFLRGAKLHGGMSRTEDYVFTHLLVSP